MPFVSIQQAGKPVVRRPLEVELRTKLELSRIESRSRLAVVFAAAGSFAKGVHSVIERIRGRFVESIEEIEPFNDQVEVHPFAEPDTSRQASVD